MAHLIDSMAYIGQRPWHGPDNYVPLKQSLYIWLQAAGDVELETAGSLKGGQKLWALAHTGQKRPGAQAIRR